MAVPVVPILVLGSVLFAAPRANARAIPCAPITVRLARGHSADAWAVSCGGIRVPWRGAIVRVYLIAG